ncbi:hypothetical protein OG874_16500 [Nocardia sp. NBC_00565]|nr:hypothetical protein [Nocardia sp. NBC_00565]WUC06619.1 hypothetical protein OG874_16500 [Nocardia sp. NBC_00565]
MSNGRSASAVGALKDRLDGTAATPWVFDGTNRIDRPNENGVVDLTK